MFYLRKISQGGIQMNFSIGKSYTLVRREEDKREFNEFIKAAPEYATEETYALIFGDDPARPLSLYRDQRNYIMTGDGKTFANVSQ